MCVFETEGFQERRSPGAAELSSAEVSAVDPVVFAAASAVLVAAALLACYLPGRRASRVNVVRMLRIG